MNAITPPRPHGLTAALIRQMSTGPAFREVTAGLLREQLQALYPTLDIDPNIAMLGTPVWRVVDDEVVATGPYYQALTDILAVQAVVAVPVLYIEGEHFLTQQPITEPAVHLPVRILDIANILNTLAPVMLRGYQATQLAFWNASEGNSGPRWHGLSSVLRDFWNVQQVPGWSDDDCNMARQLYRAPDLASRQADDPFGTRAYLVDIDQVDDTGKVTHLDEHLVTVLIGQQQGREVILSQSLLQGFKQYSSLEQLGHDLPNLVDTATTHEQLQWRLIEPPGDFFDYLACALISIQIKAIGAIDFSDLRESGTDQHPLISPPTPRSATDSTDLLPYVQALPHWLTHASASDQDTYARHLKDLATLHSEHQGQSYQEGIDPIATFARNALNDAMLKDHPDATPGLLDRLQIQVQSPVFWGLFAVPGRIDTYTFSPVELALQNLIALPVGVKTLRQNTPDALPDWLTVEYLESLVSRIDIGNTYPALIKNTLLEDPNESARRQQLYAEHLRIQLPMLALQCKMRNEAGVDEQGYRYVAAVMQADPVDRQVQGQIIVMRQLAFAPQRRLTSRADEVTNMFVIGPQNPASGPCLLYRPLLDQPLSQYPSPANLLYALQQSASLRESVLAWLPDDARNDYAQYVFPGEPTSPWTVVEFIVDPVKLWTMSGPLTLSTDTTLGNLFATLYTANANALVTLADRQTVSNAEARWATFKHAGWLIFNAALPFLGRTVGAAAWLWQILDQVQQVEDAHAHPEQQSTWAAVTELLLNVGMAITLHSVSRNAPRRMAELEPEPAVKPALERKVVVSQLPNLKPDEQLEHPQPLHISGAINRTPEQLGAVLDSFNVSKPERLGQPVSEAGPYQHLYRSAGYWYAPVGTRWFRVQVDENDQAMIVDPARHERTGPLLISNREGNWFVDTRLRLRGGGPKVLTRRAQTLARKRAEELRKQLSEFETNKAAAQDRLQQARQGMDAGPSTSAQAKRETYIQTLDSQRSDYEDALQKLKELNVHAPTPDYPQKALGYIKAQTELTQAALRETLTTFTPKLRTVLDQIERQAEEPAQRNIEDARQMHALALEMLTHLEYMQNRFTELYKLARDGTRLVRTLKGSLPAYTSDDLRALRVTLSRNLCLPETSLETAPQAWSAIDQIVDTADVAIQCLRDTLREHSEVRLDERIDTLSSLIEQFQLLDERLQDFPVEFSEQAITEQLQQLREQLTEFNRRAMSNLGLLSAERTLFRNRPTPPPTPPRPQKKFIRTRYSGLLIGEPRMTALGLDTGLVDIRSPLTHQVVATFHEKPKGLWVEHLKTPPPSPAPLDLDLSISKAQTLLDELPAFLERASTHANLADRTPIGIEYLYHQHAVRLERAMHNLEKALTQRNAVEGDGLSTSASALTKALDTALADLYETSRQHVLRTLKLHPPTVLGVEWLKSHDAISIKKTISRRRLKSPTPDYLDEYTISVRATQEVLWYAHFHYSANWTPAKAYLSARLKTVAEHRLGAAADSIKGMSTAQKVAFYRSEISLEQARTLFFERPKSESGS